MMKIKTINSIFVAAFDDTVNEFNEAHNVRYSQSHVTLMRDGQIHYSMVIFYE